MVLPKKIQSRDKGIGHTFETLSEELTSGLDLYWKTAGGILTGSGILLHDPGNAYFQLQQNFFSALFLYSYFKAGIPRPRRIFYVAANQCLRGMVTGCDNILDDEYKMTLNTDLPDKAVKFRSVLDIMVSDRVLFSLIQGLLKENDITAEQAEEASAVSLRTLTESGAQEASEEGGAGIRLEPEEILSSVHHYKTGLLFQSPWAVPRAVEQKIEGDVDEITDALYHIGMGCQVLDDMEDLAMDVAMDRHNYVASLIIHAEKNGEAPEKELRALVEQDCDVLSLFPHVRVAAARKALAFLQNGAESLFAEAHAFMTDVLIDFVIHRIGVQRYFYDL